MLALWAHRVVPTLILAAGCILAHFSLADILYSLVRADMTKALESMESSFVEKSFWKIILGSSSTRSNVIILSIICLFLTLYLSLHLQWMEVPSAVAWTTDAVCIIVLVLNSF